MELVSQLLPYIVPFNPNQNSPVKSLIKMHEKRKLLK